MRSAQRRLRSSERLIWQSLSHMARDEDISLTVLQGVGPCPVGLYKPSMSRGTSRSRTPVTWGIRWSVSAAEKDKERGGRFPTVRYEHLLGLIGRSHFPAQAQAEERKERRRLDWDRGNTIFKSSAKRKAESPKAVGRSFIYNRKRNGSMTDPWRMPLRQGASSEWTPSI